MANGFRWVVGDCGCDCTASPTGCPTCGCDGVALAMTGTINDANGDHDFPIVSAPGADVVEWYTCYEVEVTGHKVDPSLGLICGETATYNTAVAYLMRCASGTVDLYRLWQEADCGASGGWNYVPVSCGTAESQTMTSGTSFTTTLTSCNPLTLTGSPLESLEFNDPVGGDVTVTIPVATVDCVVPTTTACDIDVTLCATDTCAGDVPLDGALVTVTDQDGTTVATCTTVTLNSSGPNYASSCIDGGSGFFSWTSPANGKVDDGVYTTATSNNDQGTNLLLWTGFGFAIPAGAVPNGFLIEIGVFGSSLNEQTAQLYKAGTPIGSNLALDNPLPATLSIMSYGGSANLCGFTGTLSDINASDFGFAFQAVNHAKGAPVVSVDYGRITVYFTEGGTEGCCTVTLPADGSYTATVTKTDYPTTTKTFTVECDGGPYTFPIAVPEDCPDACVPCGLPDSDLTVSWTGPIGAGSATASKVLGRQWGTPCTALDYGATTGVIAANLICDSTETYMGVWWNASHSDCDPATTGGHLDIDPLSLTASVCDPISLTFTVANPSDLYTAGFRTFVWTL